nr:hypothetical protein [Sedimentibacter sp.]
MDVQEIFNKWQLKCRNNKAAVELWNGMAENYGGNKPLSFEDNKFLQLIRRENMLDKAYSVLDLGCGR